MANAVQKRRIQLTGFKKQEKAAIVELLLTLDCVFIDTEQYRNCTHLIAKQLSKSEKFLAACAAGKWILTKDYIINSVESGRWLDETTYEWGYKIEKGSHYSPQMQSAPKRWREELTCSGALGAFHRWKVILLVKEGDKRRDSITRVVEAGKAIIYPPQKEVRAVTHVFTDNKSVSIEREKHLFEAPYYPVQYIGDYLFENEIQNITEDNQMNHLLAEQEARDTMSDMQLVEMKNALIKHIYFAQTVKQKSTQIDQLSGCGTEVFKDEVAMLLTGILGTVVEYWILSGFMMDRNVLHQVADDLANYIAISCDDFSTQELKMFICSIPSLWLQMFVAEAVFKNLCLRRNITISAKPLSLHKIVCSYLPALGEVGVHETGKVQKVKKKKIGQWPCPESQRALLMLNGDKQNQAKLLPDLPELIFNKFPPLSKKLRMKAEVEVSNTKENRHPLDEEMHFYKTNIKDYAGWTPLHEACNHGSTVCVREILQRCPEVDLLSQVDGVTPLHDALSNGHVEIGKLLLQHGGPLLLQQRDFYGKLPLDYVESLAVKQELLDIVHPEETVKDFYERVEKDFHSQQRELWLILFNKLLLNFCSVYNLSSPSPLPFKEVAHLNSLPLVAINGCKLKSRSLTDWLVDLYVGELQTFQKLPEFIQEISENLKKSFGEQVHPLLATLETMAMATQLSTFHLSNH
ncbi:Ankyrin repeat domain-containing protein 32 [Chelonia mydas]|uniref:Ankyrin repeat domain-containing protein 32 n=1 Tax=Chelonia mydas TaxID=8469 RepID=M7BVD9_CHEMY|nr:Ankyrin repeat domain-containing protein 32 [Chelonia mydas]